MYPESAVHLDNDTVLVLIPFKTQDLQWLISAFTSGTVQIYHPAFMKYVYSWLEGHGRYPSTGFLSLMFALHICDEVNVFGYGADKQGNWHHYWEKNRNGGAFRQTGVHGGDHEYSTMLRLAATNKIKMYFGAR
ncbi:hypothetical protein CRUP_000747 [Coryphaenoides rupestris]|nr:hypothetical protein CRUP_000747 [Coryphaenoides rupestris]